MNLGEGIKPPPGAMDSGVLILPRAPTPVVSLTRVQRLSSLLPDMEMQLPVVKKQRL